jgi:hypothetical protein
LLYGIRDPTPDSRPSVIAGRCKLLGTLVAIGFRLFTVSPDHQIRDTPDVDLGYHAGRLAEIVLRSS